MAVWSVFSYCSLIRKRFFFFLLIPFLLIARPPIGGRVFARVFVGGGVLVAAVPVAGSLLWTDLGIWVTCGFLLSSAGRRKLGWDTEMLADRD